VTLAAAYDMLREFHKRAPFLFFNGNTFASPFLGVFNDVSEPPYVGQ